MDIKFNIFISHDSTDQTIAFALKKFLENLFLNSNVYVSGRDLEGGQTWIENIKFALKSSQVIIALITKKSINANWLYFESGAGFTDDKTIPLVTDNLKFENLNPPFSLLQSRRLDKEGMANLISDICRKLGLRQPTHLTNLEELLTEVSGFIENRDNEEVAKSRQQEQPKVVVQVASKPDAQILAALHELNNRAKSSLIKKLILVSDSYPIPSSEELNKMNYHDLESMAKAYNIPTPGTVALRLMGASLGLPTEDAPEWKKINVLKGFEQATKEIDKFEQS